MGVGQWRQVIFMEAAAEGKPNNRAEGPVVMAFPLHLLSMVLFSCIFF